MSAWSQADAQVIAEAAAASSGDQAAYGRMAEHFADRPGWVFGLACQDVDRLRAREAVGLADGGTLARVTEDGRQP